MAENSTDRNRELLRACGWEDGWVLCCVRGNPGGDGGRGARWPKLLHISGARAPFAQGEKGEAVVVERQTYVTFTVQTLHRFEWHLKMKLLREQKMMNLLTEGWFERALWSFWGELTGPRVLGQADGVAEV